MPILILVSEFIDILANDRIYCSSCRVLVVALGFLPKIWKVVGTYELLYCSNRNATLVVLRILGGGDIQTLLDGKRKFAIYAVADGGEAKTFQFSLPPEY